MLDCRLSQQLQQLELGCHWIESDQAFLRCKMIIHLAQMDSAMHKLYPHHDHDHMHDSKRLSYLDGPYHMHKSSSW